MNDFSRLEDNNIEKRYIDLKRIVDHRTIPSLLLLQPDGNILYCNPIKIQSIVNKAHCDWILEQFDNSTPDRFSVKTVIYSNNRSYGLRAFTLYDESQPENTLIIAVLVDEISTERLDLYKTNDSYHFAPRENDVIKELQLGMTDKMIANKLDISPATVHGYVKSIRAKLGVSTRTGILHKLFKN